MLDVRPASMYQIPRALELTGVYASRVVAREHVECPHGWNALTANLLSR